jgi:hypothetical protein
LRLATAIQNLFELNIPAIFKKSGFGFLRFVFRYAVYYFENCVLSYKLNLINLINQSVMFSAARNAANGKDMMIWGPVLIEGFCVYV